MTFRKKACAVKLLKCSIFNHHGELGAKVSSKPDARTKKKTWIKGQIARHLTDW